MTIAFRKISKVFHDGTRALHDLDLEFDSGEFIVLLGPSGSGKSTACRILAGLETPTSGTVEIAGADVTARPPRERGMSMVFQSYALYPHKSVYDNIAYPLRVRGRDKESIDRAVRDISEMLEIGDLLDRRPRQLSGGEAQRVAVARALVWQPDICLMDEPLSNLDALLRLHTRAELKRIHRELEKTFVFVTHDQEEAMSLGTRIAVLDQGRLVQFDTPQAIYHRPATRFVGEFIGRPAMNTIDGVTGTRGAGDPVFRAGTLAVVLSPGPPSSGPFRQPAAGDLADGSPVVLGIRPEAIELVDQPDERTVTMTLDVEEVIEPDTLLVVERDGVELVVRSRRRHPDLRVGDPVHLRLPSDALHLFDPETGARLT